MSQKTLIVRSAVPDIRRRQNEADYFNPLVGMTNGEYWAKEREKCRNDFSYCYEKYVRAAN